MKAFIRSNRNGKPYIFLADIGEGASKGIIKRLPIGEVKIEVDFSLVRKTLASGPVAKKFSVTSIEEVRIEQQNHLKKIAALETFIKELEAAPVLKSSKSLQKILEEKRRQLNCLRSGQL